MQPEILAYQISDQSSDVFYCFCDDNFLYEFHRTDRSRNKIAELKNIDTENIPIKIYVKPPYICVVENFGVNGVVVSSATGSHRILQREGYHEDVSSYSIAFLEYDNRICLLHQTQWNRLDITDLETGELLTDREVAIKEVRKDPNGPITTHDEINYVDYFHSELHVSPGSEYFLSNGWVWHPADVIMCFRLRDFLKRYEPGGFDLDYCFGYNWDRPCVFIDEKTFVVAVDVEGDTTEQNQHQLESYSFDTPLERYCLPSFKAVDCEVFHTDEYNELKGTLYYDEESKHLIAMSFKGTFILTLDGEVLFENRDIKSFSTKQTDPQPTGVNYRYSPKHRLLFGYDKATDTMNIVPIADLYR